MQTLALSLTSMYGLMGLGAMRNRERTRNRVQERLDWVRAGNAPVPCPPPEADPIDSFGAPQGIEDVNVATLCRDALRNAEAIADQHLARLQIAVEDGLTVRGDPRGLRAAMTRLVETATRAAPCGDVLVSAAPQGGRIQIVVLADGLFPGGNASLELALRPAGRIVALHGGTFEAEASAETGTSFTLRLLASPRTGVTDDAHAMEARRQRPRAREMTSPDALARA